MHNKNTKKKKKKFLVINYFRHVIESFISINKNEFKILSELIGQFSS